MSTIAAKILVLEGIVRLGCTLEADRENRVVRVFPPAGFRFQSTRQPGPVHVHIREDAVPDGHWAFLADRLEAGLVPENAPQSLIGHAGFSHHKDTSGAPNASHGPELNETGGKKPDGEVMP